MLWRDIGYLLQPVETIDSMGRPNKSFTRREVFCNAKGVKRSEFYQAQSQGYRPELCVEIREGDYNREDHFEYEGVVYRVIRTYPISGECVELTCQSLVKENTNVTT